MIIIDIRRFKKGFWMVLGVTMIFAVLFFTFRAIETSGRLTKEDVQYKEFKGLNGTFTYKLPSDWRTVEQNFGGGEVMYHNDFTSKDGNLRGYVQLWNLNKPLINFIKEGQKGLDSTVTFKYYTVEPIKIDGKEGYVLQYSKRDQNNKYFKAFEVFILEKDNIFCRFAFYMDEPQWKDEYREYFLNIAASARVNR